MITSIFQPERWTTTTHSSPPARADSSTSAALAPDIVLVLGDDKTSKFFAHRFVLAYHSGYFRTLFATFSGSELHLSNLDPTIFSVLLNFMYTGQLHVNAQNVYSVLTASNFLYILSIAELCEEYARQCQRKESARTASVIKPVPRKSPIAPSTVTSCHSTETLKYQPLRLNEDDSSSSIFKPVGKISLPMPMPMPPPPPSPAPSKIDENDGNSGNQETVNSTTRSSHASKIIYDIACCDGPIKFRRVVNEFYKPAAKINEVRQPSSHSSIVACHDCRIVTTRNDRSRPLRENVSSATFQFQKRDVDDGGGGGGDDDDDGTFNNVETKPSDRGRRNAESANNHEDVGGGGGVRNAIRNDVHYYPCKNCGSKFPSYYFVNKHRKLCHTNENGPSSATKED